ncbi:MAG: hypothetical protein ACXVWF_09390, partial [Actinomycetota bacterium]
MRVLPVAVLATGVLALASPAALAGTANLPSARGVEPVVTPAGGSDPAAECAALTDRPDVAALRLPGGADGFP